MAKNDPRIVGSPFDDWVTTQIKQRQAVYGSGMNSPRTSSQINYLNSRTSFIRAFSSVNIGGEGSENRLKTLKQQTNSSNSGFGAGIDLASKFILSNTVSRYNSSEQRAGVTKNNNKAINQFSYGFGGTQFGIQPPPGIESFEINHINRGSIRRGTLNIKANNKFQFEVIENLYMRLGFTMLIEWGHSKILKNDGNVGEINSILGDRWFIEKGSKGALEGLDHLQVAQQITKAKKNNYGNYDAMFARIVNFSWNFNTDGSYNINISLLSLGSIVESLKINNLDSLSRWVINDKRLDNYATEEDESNLDIISNYLYQIKKNQINPNNGEPSFLFNQPTPEGPIDFLQLQTSSVPQSVGAAFVASNQMGAVQSQNDPTLAYYIRFGELLRFLEQETISWFADPCEPLVYINESQNNLMKSGDNIISFNPDKCIVNLSHINLQTKKDISIPFPLKSSLTSQQFQITLPDSRNRDKKYGIITNVYLNIDNLRNILKSYLPGQLSLYTFLTRICSDINESFANISNLEVVYDEESHSIEIKDQNLEPRLDCNQRKFLPPPPKSDSIIIYGYENNNSNFVLDYTFKTQISPEIVSQLSIGAAAANQNVTEDATAFSKWNWGLEDRFQKLLTSVKNEDTCGGKKRREEIAKIEEFTRIGKNLQRERDNRLLGILGDIPLKTSPIDNFKTTWEGSAKFQAKVTADYEDFLIKMFSIERNDGTIGTYVNLTDNKKNKLSNLYLQYIRNFYKEELKRILKLNIKDSERTNDHIETLLGFIPVELSLKLDGISGMRIYEELNISQDFLPANYPRNLVFVITGIGHQISDQNWTTILTAIPKTS